MPPAAVPEARSLRATVWNLAVVVAALGYFVDIYDLLLFGIVRQPSLTALGFSGPELLSRGTELLNFQMGGMLLGGILWGVLGDKRGRLSVLFGSIFLYSLANACNGAVHTLAMYALWRFVAGVGLAGELGAGITLVSEVMTSEHRGYGTSIVSGFGILGAVVAALVGKLFDWRMAYYVGGGLGIALLLLRIGAYESGMFDQVRAASTVARGNFFALFNRRDRLLRYVRGIVIGVPIWYVIGILVTFAPELAQTLGIAIDAATGKTTITGREAIMYHYAGAALGSLLCGWLSQLLRSRRRALFWFMSVDVVLVAAYVLLRGASAPVFYVYLAVLGVMTGYWAIFVTVASEQFGTNLRATATTTTPNFVRGSVVPMTMAFTLLQAHGSKVVAAMTVGAVVWALAFLALWRTEETYGRDLEYVEPL